VTDQLEQRSDDDELLRIRDLTEHYVSVRTAEDAEDLAQEAMARLLASRSRLSRDVWPAYAVMTARNLLVNRERERSRALRNQHRLLMPDTQPSAEEGVLLREQHEALQRAVEHLPDSDRQVLVRHYAEDDASRTRSVSGALAARLARARARLRVAYLLEHGKVVLPTPSCLAVLESLSAGDRRRQERVGAARHLLTCGVCAEHGSALVDRKRAGVGLNPMLWLGVTGGVVWQAVRRHPAQSSAATAGVAACCVVAAVLVSSRGPAAPAAAPPSVPAARASGVWVADVPVLPRTGTPLPTGPAVAREVRVLSVPADEGFWVGSDTSDRLFVRLVGAGESRPTVAVGDVVSFSGRMLRPEPGLARALGVSAQEGAADLVRDDGYVAVQQDDLVVRPG
jgi:RNA polymerase sigma factor (sigma-70 family)